MKGVIAIARAVIAALFHGGVRPGSPAGRTTVRGAGLHEPGPRRRKRFASRGLILFLVAVMALGPNLQVASVRAADPSPPLIRSGPWASMQEKAIQNVLTSHGLPASDAWAVKSWARNDALAELWALVVEAIKTEANERTPEQQAAVDWLTGLVRQKRMQQARYAGQEYVKWAGYSQEAFDDLVDQYYDAVARGEDTTDEKQALRNYLELPPLNYGMCNGGSCVGLTLRQAQAQAQAGYCVYRSPAPYQTEYQGNIFRGTNSVMPADCVQPGGGIGGIIGTPPPVPEYDQFVKWGEARANYEAINNPEFAITFRDIALVVGLGTVTAGMAVAGTLGVTLAPVLAGTAFQLAVFPHAGWVSGLSSATLAAIGSPATNSAAVAAANAGAVSAAGVGAIVAAVILFVVVTTIHLIDLVTIEQLPGKIHTLIVEAPTKSYDIRSMLDDKDEVGELYSLFVQATLPLPMITEACDNRILSLNKPTCLNPPPPPPANAQTDPLFMVSVNGGQETLQNTITWYNKTTEWTTTARLKGVWFIQTVTDSEGNTLSVVTNDGEASQEIQSLRIMYTDWDDKAQYAWLVRDAQGAYKFVSLAGDSGASLNAETCDQDGICAVSDSIRYIDRDGNEYEARVVPPPVPVIDPASISLSPANPVQGQEVELRAQATSPIGAALTYRWVIKDKPLDDVLHCTIVDGSLVCGGHTVTVTGNPAKYVFPTSGEFEIRLEVTDSEGRRATTDFKVNVTAVPAEVHLLTPCSDFLPCAPGFFNNVKVPLGTATVVKGWIQHAGPHDVLALTVDWGDGVSNVTTNTAPPCPQCNGIVFLSPTKMEDGYHTAFELSHTYGRPGHYTVTVTVEYPSGTTDTATITETVLQPTTTSVTADPNPSMVGQAVSFTAAVSPVPTGGTVTFTDGNTIIPGCDALALATDGTATCTTAGLSLGEHSITASYSGHDFYDGSSGTVTQRVDKIATSLGLAAQPSPSVWGQKVTFTATLSTTLPGATAPSGTIGFTAGGASIPGCESRPLDPTTLTATCTTAALSAGEHTIRAAYSGDATYAPSEAPAFTHTVQQAASQVSRVTDRPVVTAGEPVTLTATVTVLPPGAGVPTGTVTFFAGATPLGTVTLTSNAGVATATLTTASLAAGTHVITAAYSGDANVAASTSAALTQYVNTDLSAYRNSQGMLNLQKAQLPGATLVGVDLTGVSLRLANLAGANLRGARLVRADLAGADLRGADLTDADLSGALLGAARLTGVHWGNTTCPDGTNSDAHGSTCDGHLLPTARNDVVGLVARLVQALFRRLPVVPGGVAVGWPIRR
ncbi:Ig-like domain repeat protein [Sphaerobacter sp.]|uniref:Ig-like domain repeat protein n=1 Tax=Sphaerobacter sp. TaxID=2099654 RepID=UPI001E14B03B|nr:Ig-like domain repeat protein [Sphaerobacter sp.]MBX5445539.1 Ig-like domain repeat protein [Sphaerobacter sp.]